MSIIKMELISIVGLIDELKSTIRICGESKIFHPDDVNAFYPNTKDFSAISKQTSYASLLKILSDSASLMNKELELIRDFNEKAMSDVEFFINTFSEKLKFLIEKKKNYLENVQKNADEIEILSKFLKIKESINEILSCDALKPMFGKIPKEKIEELKDHNDQKKIVFKEYSVDSSHYFGICFSFVEGMDEINKFLSNFSFEEIKIKPFEGTFAEKSEILTKTTVQIQEKIKETEAEIEKFWEEKKKECCEVYSYLTMLDKYEKIKKYVLAYNNSFILVGWIPKEKKNEFCQKLSKLNSIEIDTENAENLLKNNPPTKLKNKRLFKAFEFIVENYGTPAYNEIDPTIFVAITYTLLFGIMFADVGQGIILSIIGHLMWKLKKLQLGKILVPCGISSALFGVVFSSVFGFEHLLDGFYKTVFHLSKKPIEVADPNSTVLIFVVTIGIGSILVVIATILNIFTLIKRKKYAHAIFETNGICSLFFYLSGIFAVIDLLFLKSGITNDLFIEFFIILPVILMFFKEKIINLFEKSHKTVSVNWKDYIVQNLCEMLEIVLSYITNTLSFVRVGAYVLVHAGMMTVVVLLAETFPIIFFPIIIMGNMLVIVVEATLAGIQVLRLEFYELFNKFFQGQGREFEPISIDHGK